MKKPLKCDFGSNDCYIRQRYYAWEFFIYAFLNSMIVVGYRLFIVILWGGWGPWKKFISTKDYESLPGLELAPVGSESDGLPLRHGELKWSDF